MSGRDAEAERRRYEVPPHHVERDLVERDLPSRAPGGMAAGAGAPSACGAVDLVGGSAYRCGLPGDGHRRHRALWAYAVAPGRADGPVGATGTYLGEAGAREWDAPAPEGDDHRSS